MTLDLDSGREIRQDLDADFGLTMWDHEHDSPEWLIDEGTPIHGYHDIEWQGVRYQVCVEITRMDDR